MLNTFEKTKAHEARRAAIQRQMEAMETAATSRAAASTTTTTTQPPNPDSSSSTSGVGSTTRRRLTGGAAAVVADPVSAPTSHHQGSLETARRFLWDEDEEDAAGTKFTATGRVATDDNLRRDGGKTSSSTNERMSGGIFGILRTAFGGGGQKGTSTSRSIDRTTNISVEGQKRLGAFSDEPYRPSFMTSCYIFLRRLMLKISLAIGSCLTWIRTRWTMMMGSGRKGKLFLIFLLLLVIIIPIAIFVPRDRSGDGGRTSSLSSSQRFDLIKTRITSTDLTPLDILLTEDSPQRKALEWIVAEDPAQLDPDDEYLLPRYSLAVFYFSTHGDEMFQTIVVNITESTDTTSDTSTPSKQDTATAATREPLIPEGQTTAALGDDIAAQPNWIRESGWLSGEGYCSWFGVECHHREGTSVYNTRYDDNNGVILLNMTENNVRGKLPPELFQANPDLRWFSVSGNGFFGGIPEQIGSLTQMLYLSMANNFFTGSLPSSITQMKELNSLHVDGNYFKGSLPQGLGNMTSLETLSMFNNFFSGTLSPDIGNLKNLTTLYLDMNHLQGSIPSEIGMLTAMIDLRLRHNQLVGTIPSSLGTLTDLEILYLDRNTLTGTIPTELVRAVRLGELHLYRNKIKGPIPTEIGLFKELTSLYLDNNHLSGQIPTELGTLDQLQQLYLHKNRIEGTIPSQLGRLENLFDFRAYTNGIVGKIPVELTKAFKLETLYLQDNLLTGDVPNSMVELTRLQKLRLYWNHLKGTVSTEVCDLLSYKLAEFTTDCAGESPEITCTCCTACF